MSFRSYRIWLLCLVLLPAGVLAFSADEPARPPEVPVARPVVREVTDYEDFVGRVEASKRVEVRSLVTGYLVKTAFQEGAEVKKGDLLFEIDPRLYQVELDLALAQVELDKAALKLAQVTLAARNQLDQDKAAVDVAIARVKGFRSQRRASQVQPELLQGDRTHQRPDCPDFPDARRPRQREGDPSGCPRQRQAGLRLFRR